METGNSNIRLEERLKDWRAGLFGEGLSKDDKDELQGHLEDTYNELREKGLSEEDAWILATNKIGTAETIKTEFRKIRDSQVPIFNHVFYWLMLVLLSLQILNIGEEMLVDLFRLGTLRIYSLIASLILLWIVLRIIYKRRAIQANTRMEVFFTSVSLIVLGLAFGFFTWFEQPTCNNKNQVFENNSPKSDAYRRELQRVFTRIGSDNMYFIFNSYFSENGKDYIMVKAIGEDFCADFQVNIKYSKKWGKYLRETKGMGRTGVEMKGFKFDMVKQNGGMEYLLRDIALFVD